MSSEPRNLLTPFRRDLKSDFASGTGEDLERSKVTQVLATEGATPRTSGELPWRTNFGSALHLLRHQRNDEALGELARVYCQDAIKVWLAYLGASSIGVGLEGSVLVVTFRAQGEESGTEKARHVAVVGGVRPIHSSP